LIDRNDGLNIEAQTVSQQCLLDRNIESGHIGRSFPTKKALVAKRAEIGEIVVCNANADRASVLRGLRRGQGEFSIQGHEMAMKGV